MNFILWRVCREVLDVTIEYFSGEVQKKVLNQIEIITLFTNFSLIYDWLNNIYDGYIHLNIQNLRICGRQYEERRVRQYRSVLLLLGKSFLVLVVRSSSGSAGVPETLQMFMLTMLIIITTISWRCWKINIMLMADQHHDDEPRKLLRKSFLSLVVDSCCSPDVPAATPRILRNYPRRRLWNSLPTILLMSSWQLKTYKGFRALALLQCFRGSRVLAGIMCLCCWSGGIFSPQLCNDAAVWLLICHVFAQRPRLYNYTGSVSLMLLLSQRVAKVWLLFHIYDAVASTQPPFWFCPFPNWVKHHNHRKSLKYKCNLDHCVLSSLL